MFLIPLFKTLPTASNLKVKAKVFTTAHKAEHKLTLHDLLVISLDYFLSLSYASWLFMASLWFGKHTRHALASGLMQEPCSLTSFRFLLKWYLLRPSWYLKLPSASGLPYPYPLWYIFIFLHSTYHQILHTLLAYLLIYMWEKGLQSFFPLINPHPQ